MPLRCSAACRSRPGRAGHAHVEQHAARAIGRWMQQELAGRRVAARLEARRIEQVEQRSRAATRRRRRHGSERVQCSSCGARASGRCLRCTGSSTRKTAPSPGRSPPRCGRRAPRRWCARSTGPGPCRRCLVLKNESKSFGQVLRRDARPRSRTDHGVLRPRWLDRHDDPAPVVGQSGDRIHGVEHQVDEHLLDLRPDRPPHEPAVACSGTTRRPHLRRASGLAGWHVGIADDLGEVERLALGSLCLARSVRKRRMTSLARRSSRRMRATMRSRSSRRSAPDWQDQLGRVGTGQDRRRAAG